MENGAYDERLRDWSSVLREVVMERDLCVSQTGNGRVLYQARGQGFSHGNVKVVVQTTQGDGFPGMFFKPDCEKP